MLELPGSFPKRDQKQGRESSLEDAPLNKGSCSCPQLRQEGGCLGLSSIR